MYINSAKRMDSILKNYDSGRADPHDVEYTFTLHRKAMDFYRKNRNAVPTRANYEEAAEHILETTGVELTVEQIEEILTLFPSARIKLAVYDGCRYDTEVRDLIYDAACSFFACSEAPTNGDAVDMDRFIKHLQFQANQMGYKSTSFSCEHY